MAHISIFKEVGGAKLGAGTGTFDKATKIATITAWTTRAGVRAGKTYALEIGRTTYSSAYCSAVTTTAPLATFTNVE